MTLDPCVFLSLRDMKLNKWEKKCNEGRTHNEVSKQVGVRKFVREMIRVHTLVLFPSSLSITKQPLDSPTEREGGSRNRNFDKGKRTKGNEREGVAKGHGMMGPHLR